MDIHALPATALVAALRDGSLTSTAIVEALIARREAVDPGINAFVFTCTEALSEARAADRARADGMNLGPLFGLPVTVKDNVDIAGVDSTLGLRARCNQPVADDAVLVTLLRELGAIVLGKTNARDRCSWRSRQAVSRWCWPAASKPHWALRPTASACTG